MTDFPEGFQGAGPVFAAVPDLSDQWFTLAGKGVTTYVVESPELDPDGHVTGTAFLDQADAEVAADAAAGGEFWHWEGQIGWTEHTPARMEAERQAGDPQADPDPQLAPPMSDGFCRAVGEYVRAENAKAEREAEEWAEAAYAEMLAEPGWPADIRSVDEPEAGQ